MGGLCGDVLCWPYWPYWPYWRDWRNRRNRRNRRDRRDWRYWQHATAPLAKLHLPGLTGQRVNVE